MAPFRCTALSIINARPVRFKNAEAKPPAAVILPAEDSDWTRKDMVNAITTYLDGRNST